LGYAVLWAASLGALSWMPKATVMASNHECAALAAAKQRTGLSYGQIAERVNSTEQRITGICTGKIVPTQVEFDAITVALGIQDKAPRDAAHKTA